MADEATSLPHKWQGKATAELNGPSTDQVWPFLEDFCNLHKWLPNLDTCVHVDGVIGQPGLIRYCASTTKASLDGADDEITIKWAKEKLLMIDPSTHCLSYEIVDNNIGFNSYTATIKVLPMDGDECCGCQIEWWFVCDPIEGWSYEDLISYIESGLQFMARKMEEVLLSTPPI